MLVFGRVSHWMQSGLKFSSDSFWSPTWQFWILKYLQLKNGKACQTGKSSDVKCCFMTGWYWLKLKGLHLHDCSSALGNDDANVLLVTSAKRKKITRAKSSTGSSNIMSRIQHQQHCGKVSREAWKMSTSYRKLKLNWNFWNSRTTSYWFQ